MFLIYEKPQAKAISATNQKQRLMNWKNKDMPYNLKTKQRITLNQTSL